MDGKDALRVTNAGSMNRDLVMMGVRVECLPEENGGWM